MIGIVSRWEALKQAESSEIDLVEVAPDATPPVCKLMDYGKFLYRESKKAHDAKVHAAKSVVKEVKFRPNTDKNDYQVKLRNILRFLSEGNRVKVTLQFRGREMTHQKLGLDLLNRLAEDVNEHGQVENRPKLEGRQFVMVIGKKKGATIG